jgi:hypothetical protein
MGPKCAPILVDLFLHDYETNFFKGFLKNENKKLAKTFHQTEQICCRLKSITLNYLVLFIFIIRFLIAFDKVRFVSSNPRFLCSRFFFESRRRVLDFSCTRGMGFSRMKIKNYPKPLISASAL